MIEPSPALPASGALLSSLTWVSPRFWSREAVMRWKAGHSMMSNMPSTHPSEGAREG
jgi:hypothetical protein